MQINPADYQLLGIKWRGLYYYDRAMPMGCSSSRRTFEAFSTAAEWITPEKLLIDKLLHLLDDFLIISSTYDVYKAHLALFVRLRDFLGIPIALDKTFGSSTVLRFAGIELDSLNWEAHLPQEKLTSASNALPVFAADRREAAHYSCGGNIVTRAQSSIPSYVYSSLSTFRLVT